jgi:hypothetical protein
VVLCACLAAIAGVLYKSNLGRALRALADDLPVATALCLPPKILFPAAFGVATGLAGFTGALVTPILSLHPHIGDSILTISFMIVILGGLGSVVGAAVAAFVVGLVEAYSSIYLGGSIGALTLFLLVVISWWCVLPGCSAARCGRLIMHRKSLVGLARQFVRQGEVPRSLSRSGVRGAFATGSPLVFSDQSDPDCHHRRSAYIMLRMDLLSFALPAFMAWAVMQSQSRQGRYANQSHHAISFAVPR